MYILYIFPSLSAENREKFDNSGRLFLPRMASLVALQLTEGLNGVY